MELFFVNLLEKKKKAYIFALQFQVCRRGGITLLGRDRFDSPAGFGIRRKIYADVAELVDALDSKSSSSNRVGVRFPPSVLTD